MPLCQRFGSKKAEVLTVVSLNCRKFLFLLVKLVTVWTQAAVISPDFTEGQWTDMDIFTCSTESHRSRWTGPYLSLLSLSSAQQLSPFVVRSFSSLLSFPFSTALSSFFLHVPVRSHQAFSNSLQWALWHRSVILSSMFRVKPFYK